MNNPLGNLIFKVIEQALEQDAVRRMEGGATQVAPQLSQSELKHQAHSRVEAKLMKARARQGLHRARQESSMPTEQTSEIPVAEPKADSPKPEPSFFSQKTSFVSQRETPSLKSLLLGQIILGPCKALEAP